MELLPCSVASVSTGALQVVQVESRSGSLSFKAWALCDGGSTHSWISDGLRRQMSLGGSDETISVHGITGQVLEETKRAELELRSLEDSSFEPTKFSALVKSGLSLGSDKIDVSRLKEQCPHLEVISADEIDFRKVSVIIGQDVFSAIQPMEQCPQQCPH